MKTKTIMNLKKLIITLVMMFGALHSKAQAQYKIPDPTTAFCIGEYRKSEGYKNQLKELGLTDADVTIKVNEALSKSYSGRCDAKIKAMIEADVTNLGIEISTKKKNGMAYSAVGYITCTRTDVAADSYGDYISKINNTWKIYVFNVDDLKPEGGYLMDPKKLRDLIVEEIEKGNLKLEFGASSNYEKNEVIEIESITPITKAEADKGLGREPEMLSGNKQKTYFIWTYKLASYTNDYSYIKKVTQYTDADTYLETTLKNGKITIDRYYTVNSGKDKGIYFSEQVPYDTLFGNATQDGIKAVYKTRKIKETGVVKRREDFITGLVDKICSLSGKETEQQIKESLSPYVHSETLSNLSSAIFRKFSNGTKLVPGKRSGNRFELNCEAINKKGKQYSGNRAFEIIYNQIDNIKKEGDAYKFWTNFSIG